LETDGEYAAAAEAGIEEVDGPGWTGCAKEGQTWLQARGDADCEETRKASVNRVNAEGELEKGKQSQGGRKRTGQSGNNVGQCHRLTGVNKSKLGPRLAGDETGGRHQLARALACHVQSSTFTFLWTEQASPTAAAGPISRRDVVIVRPGRCECCMPGRAQASRAGQLAWPCLGTESAVPDPRASVVSHGTVLRSAQ
jgi:hypothetical protein